MTRVWLLLVAWFGGRRRVMSVLLDYARRVRRAEQTALSATVAADQDRATYVAERAADRDRHAAELAAVRAEVDEQRAENIRWAGVNTAQVAALVYERRIGNEQAALLRQVQAVAYHRDLPPNLAVELRRVVQQIPHYRTPPVSVKEPVHDHR